MQPTITPASATTPLAASLGRAGESPLTLVTAGTGKTGRRVAARLTARGESVRIGSRSGQPPFDWTDRSSWSAALDEATKAYVAYQPDLAVPDAIEAIRRFGEEARAAGLDRLVLLSGRGEPEAQACEDVLLGCGVDTTVVRCAFFAQNFSEHFLVGSVLEGVIVLPAGDVTEPIVDADDIADVAVAALTEPGHAGRVYELTGPRLMTFHDVAGELTAALGRPVTYLPVTGDEYVTAAVDAGVSLDEATMLADLFAHIFAGHNSFLANGVHEILGRPARDFREFAAGAAAANAWDPSPVAVGE